MYNFEDATGKFISTFFFIALILMCSMLFMNIIVAVLLSNYTENTEENDDEDLKEIEERGNQVGIPSNILQLIIEYDLVSKTKTTMSWKRFTNSIKRIFIPKQKAEIPKSKYFDYKIVRFLYY